MSSIILRANIQVWYNFNYLEETQLSFIHSKARSRGTLSLKLRLIFFYAHFNESFFSDLGVERHLSINSCSSPKLMFSNPRPPYLLCWLLLVTGSAQVGQFWVRISQTWAIYRITWCRIKMQHCLKSTFKEHDLKAGEHKNSDKLCRYAVLCIMDLQQIHVKCILWKKPLIDFNCLAPK